MHRFDFWYFFWLALYLGVATLFYRKLQYRKPKRPRVLKSMSEYPVGGFVINITDNTVGNALMSFHESGDILLLYENGKRIELPRRDIIKVCFPLTYSIGMTHIKLITSRGTFLMMDDVTLDQLFEAANKTPPPVIKIKEAQEEIRQRLHDESGYNIHVDSDPHAELAAWFRIKNFPSFKPQLVASDVYGFYIIMLLPTWLIVVFTAAAIGDTFFGDSEIENVVGGIFGIMTMFITAVFYYGNSFYLHRKFNKAKII